MSASAVPTPVVVEAGVKFVDAGLAPWHTLLLSDSGQVYACGWNEFGQTGGFNETLGKIEFDVSSSSAQANWSANVTQVACGTRHSVMLTDNSLFGFGWGKKGGLGQGPDLTDSPEPLKIPIPATSGMNGITCSPWATLKAVLYRLC